MKSIQTKCTWTACIAVMALCTAITTAYADNLGVGYISNVTPANGECVFNTPTGNTGHKWDIQAGGTYTIRLSNVIDACSQGNLSSIQVIVHNSIGGNICTTATQVDNNQGEYQFTITLSGQCLTMPIQYCTANCSASTQEALFAQGFDGTGGDGKLGHLRTATFDSNCNVTGEDTVCTTATPTPTPCAGASITACKFYDSNANATKETGELPLKWPFCLTSITNPNFAPLQQNSDTNGCTTFSNLGPGSYLVTEGIGGGTWTGSTTSSMITIDHCGQNVTVNFGNFCTVNSGGLTMGFWSNKNGNKILTGNTAGNGTTLLPSVVTLLNSCSMRNANGTVHTFLGTNTGYADFKNWLLGANATNMAYMLSAQLAALKLDVNFGMVDGNAYDLCSITTVNGLISAACTQLAANGYTITGNANRTNQEILKNCIDAINNNGPVVPVTPCDTTGASVTCTQ